MYSIALYKMCKSDAQKQEKEEKETIIMYDFCIGIPNPFGDKYSAVNRESHIK